MYIFKNAVMNIGRNKGRNILMAVIIFAIILTTVISIIINTTTREIIDDYKSRFGTEVTIDFDYDKLSKAGSGIEFLTLQQQVDFSKSELLKNTIFEGSLPVILEKIDPVPGEMDSFIPEDTDYLPNARLCGTNREYVSEDFESGARKIIEGRMYENRSECIVSRQLAALNNLSVGDSIEVRAENSGKGYTAYKLIVSGIFEDLTMLPENSKFEQYATLANRNNEILTDFETLDTSGLIDYEMIRDPFFVRYILKDPAMLEDFKEELTEKGLPEYYRALTDEVSYKRIVGPVEGMAKITTTFLFVVLILGSVVLIVLSTLSIRERKYEIGVLRAIGMSKGKVALGLLFEVLIITSICLVIGLGVGAVVSQPVADSLLSTQIEISQEDSPSGQTQIYSDIFTKNNPSLEQADPLSEVTVRLTAPAIMVIAAISLMLIVISTMVSIIYITKLEPVKILSERN